MDVEKLTPKYIGIYKQLVCLAKLYEDSLDYDSEGLGIDFENIFSNFASVSDERRQVMI